MDVSDVYKWSLGDVNEWLKSVSNVSYVLIFADC